MIQAMTDVFKECGNKWHIADFFTKVSEFQGTVWSAHSEANALDEKVFVTGLSPAMQVFA